MSIDHIGSIGKSLPDKLIEQISASKVSLHMSYNYANNAESCGAARSSWDSLSAQLSLSSGPADEQGGVSCAVPAHGPRIAKTTTAIYEFAFSLCQWNSVDRDRNTHKNGNKKFIIDYFFSLATCRNQPRRRRSMPQLFIGQARGENRGERAEPCKRGVGGGGDGQRTVGSPVKVSLAMPAVHYCIILWIPVTADTIRSMSTADEATAIMFGLEFLAGEYVHTSVLFVGACLTGASARPPHWRRLREMRAPFLPQLTEGGGGGGG